VIEMVDDSETCTVMITALVERFSLIEKELELENIGAVLSIRKRIMMIPDPPLAPE
jgi:hypothetical protein